MFLPYAVYKITAKRIVICALTGHKGLGPEMFLNRQVMERDGKQYHTKFHEYFYAVKPKVDPEHRYYEWRIPSFHQVFGDSEYLTTLGLKQPYTVNEAKRAYRRLAKTAHPDKGGSTQAFVKLKTAFDTALRFAT